MLARRLATILPAMTLAEAIETTRGYSVADRAMATKPPDHAYLSPSGTPRVRIYSLPYRAAHTLSLLERRAMTVYRR
jgi:predicted ATPase with chaperone activity